MVNLALSLRRSDKGPFIIPFSRLVLQATSSNPKKRPPLPRWASNCQPTPIQTRSGLWSWPTLTATWPRRMPSTCTGWWATFAATTSPPAKRSSTTCSRSPPSERDTTDSCLCCTNRYVACDYSQLACLNRVWSEYRDESAVFSKNQSADLIKKTGQVIWLGSVVKLD